MSSSSSSSSVIVPEGDDTNNVGSDHNNKVSCQKKKMSPQELLQLLHFVPLNVRKKTISTTTTASLTMDDDTVVVVVDHHNENEKATDTTTDTDDDVNRMMIIMWPCLKFPQLEMMEQLRQQNQIDMDVSLYLQIMYDYMNHICCGCNNNNNNNSIVTTTTTEIATTTTTTSSVCLLFGNTTPENLRTVFVSASISAEGEQVIPMNLMNLMNCTQKYKMIPGYLEAMKFTQPFYKLALVVQEGCRRNNHNNHNNNNNNNNMEPKLQIRSTPGLFYIHSDPNKNNNNNNTNMSSRTPLQQPNKNNLIIIPGSTTTKVTTIKPTTTTATTISTLKHKNKATVEPATIRTTTTTTTTTTLGKTSDLLDSVARQILPSNHDEQQQQQQQKKKKMVMISNGMNTITSNTTTSTTIVKASSATALLSVVVEDSTTNQVQPHHHHHHPMLKDHNRNYHTPLREDLHCHVPTAAAAADDDDDDDCEEMSAVVVSNDKLGRTGTTNVPPPSPPKTTTMTSTIVSGTGAVTVSPPVGDSSFSHHYLTIPVTIVLDKNNHKLKTKFDTMYDDCGSSSSIHYDHSNVFHIPTLKEVMTIFSRYKKKEVDLLKTPSPVGNKNKMNGSPSSPSLLSSSHDYKYLCRIVDRYFLSQHNKMNQGFQDPFLLSDLLHLRNHLCAYGVPMEMNGLSEKSRTVITIWVSCAVVKSLTDTDSNSNRYENGNGDNNNDDDNNQVVQPNHHHQSAIYRVRKLQPLDAVKILRGMGFKYVHGDLTGAGYLFPGLRPTQAISGKNFFLKDTEMFYTLSRFGLPPNCTFDTVSFDDRLALEVFLAGNIKMNVFDMKTDDVETTTSTTRKRSSTSSTNTIHSSHHRNNNRTKFNID